MATTTPVPTTASTNPTDDDAFAHLLDMVIQLPTKSDVRDFFQRERVMNLGNFAVAVQYDNFYPAKGAGDNALSVMALMDLSLIHI